MFGVAVHRGYFSPIVESRESTPRALPAEVINRGAGCLSILMPDAPLAQTLNLITEVNMRLIRPLPRGRYLGSAG